MRRFESELHMTDGKDEKKLDEQQSKAKPTLCVEDCGGSCYAVLPIELLHYLHYE